MTRCVLILLIATLVAYVVQVFVDRVAYGQFTSLFGLSVVGVLQGRLWQFLTYMFLHGGVGHILLNMLSLFLIGPELERTMGRKHFAILYFTSGILGGLGWFAMEYGHMATCVGASGAVFGILGAFAALFPNRPMTLLVFFILPVTMRTWVMVAALLGIQLLLVISSVGGSIAYVAHIGGAVAGYIYARTVFRGDVNSDSVMDGLRRSLSTRAEARRQERTAADREEVDRILDKVASQGIHSLTPKERKTLDAASDRLRR